MLTAPGTPGTPAEEPTASLISSLAVWHWIENTPAGSVAFLLLAHPAPGRDDSPAEVALHMRELATSLGLAECSTPLPDIGPRLLIHELGAFLHLDKCEYLLHAPVGGSWSEFARAGGTITVAAGLDPLRAHSSRDAVEAYMANTARVGRLYMGKTHLSHPAGTDMSVAAGEGEEL